MYRATLVLLPALLNFSTTTSQECTVSKDDNTVITWSGTQENNLGSFPKNIGADHALPGLSLQSAPWKSLFEDDSCNVAKFFVFDNNETYVSIKTSGGFTDWDKDNVASGTTSGTCKFSILFDPAATCNVATAAKILKFYYTVNDVNLSPPIFSQPSYEFKVPFPIGQGVSLNAAFGISIQTTDPDFSTNKVSYEIQGGSEDFQVVTPPKSGATYSVELRTKRSVNLQKAAVLTLVATDDGTDPGPKQSTATIAITPDAENSSPPVPEFTETLYSGTIKLSELQVGDALPVTVSLKEAYESVELATAPSDLVAPTIGPDGMSITLTLQKDFDPDGLTFTTIVLSATISNGFNKATSNAVIVLGLEPDTSSSSSTSTSTTDPDAPTASTSTTDPSAPTDSTSTTDPNAPTDSTSTTDPNAPTSSSTDPNVPTSTSTRPTEPTQPTDEPASDDVGLTAATAVLAVLVVGLLGVVGYGYYRYIYKAVPATLIPTSATLPKATTFNNGGGSVAVTMEGNKTPVTVKTLKPVDDRTRKRSVTFSEDDVESRVNRETKSNSELSEVESSGNDSKTESDNTSTSTVYNVLDDNEKRNHTLI